MKAQFITMFQKVHCFMFITLALSIFTSSFSQVTVQGTVKSSVDQSAVENALVELIKLDVLGLDTTRSTIGSVLTDQNGSFLFQLSTNINKFSTLPQTFEISGNYPNPFLDETKIQMTVLNRSNYQISIFNILGQQVAHIQKDLNPGNYTIQWKGCELPGVYFAKIQAGNEIHTIKLVQLNKRTKSSALNIQANPATPMLKRSQSINGISFSYLQIVVSKENFYKYNSPVLDRSNQSIDVILIKIIDVVIPQPTKVVIFSDSTGEATIESKLFDTAIIVQTFDEQSIPVSDIQISYSEYINEEEKIAVIYLRDPKGIYLDAVFWGDPTNFTIPNSLNFRKQNIFVITGLIPYHFHRFDFLPSPSINSFSLPL